ncbi:unnamed protein product, partial [Tetraodon nigroviridis]
WKRVACILILAAFWSAVAAQIRYSISEEVKEGTVVGNIAKDLGIDKASLKEREYRIVGASAEPLFRVNREDGILYVSKKLDREVICEKSNVCVINLKTVLENPLEIHYVAIEVLDVNDHSPTFPENEKRLEIFESTSTGARFQLQPARDPDGGQFTVQQYRLSPNDHFRLEVKERGEDRKMPFLILQKALDREAMKEHKLVLTAVDGGRPAKSGTMGIIIQVLDVNDNSPVFTKEVYSASVNENSPPGTLVTRVNATDLDEGANGDIIYSFGQEVDTRVKNKFSIDPKTGDIKVTGVIDFEENESYEIDVQASDKGTIPLSTYRSVIIKVKDLNDNPPEIEITSFSKSVPEDSRIGTTVALISASDLDSVVASDSGSPSLSSNVTVKVFILDQNDNAPVILYPVSSNGSAEGLEEIPRNVNAGHLVTKVRAYDADIGYNGWLLFALQEVSDHSLFGLDRYTGQIRTLRSFTETDEAEHKLVILVKDNGNVSLSATATVLVKLVEPKEAFAASDVQSSAQDDEDSHVTFYLMITLGSVSVLFVISIIVLIAMQYRSGDKRYMLVGPRMSIGSTIVPGSHANTLVLPDRRRTNEERLLDREKLREHHLILTAVDGGNPPRSGTLNVTVIVLDSNDNHPIFSQEVYSADVPENVAAGTSVIKVKATDLDEGANGEIEYFFGGQQDRRTFDIFDLNKETGEIKVKGGIDFEKVEVFKLDVHATDKGQPPMSTDCTVIIKVLDQNDNAPQIEVTSLSNVVPEDSKPGTVISLISITDLDAGLNGKVMCSLSDNSPFDLKPSFQENMYSLVLKQPLDRESVSHYDVTITATDCGQPALSDFKTLSIDVSDVNDNAPKYSHSPIELYLVENNAPGSQIFSVTASDKDLNENADISYHIIREEGGQGKNAAFLNINAENGQISALKSFDFETLKTFQFQVVASDSGSPSLSSNVTVKVFILDQNDNAPVILYPVSSNGSAEGLEEIPRNVNAGHLVTKVRAYDADIGYNGWLLFALQEVSDHSLFGLDRYTGQIRTLRSFTETDEAEHKLVILVKDNGNVSLSATATVLVKLVEPKEAFAASDVQSSVRDDEDGHVTFYLMITLGSVSVLFVISIIVLIAMQCSKSPDYTSKYVPETNYDGTLCHSIQYRSGDKRYMLVGPRMSIGSTIVPGSHANTLVLPDRRRTNEELRYSIPEELGVGAVIGNVAKDLGLDANALNARGFRIVSGSSEPPFQLSNNGILHVNRIIDREEVCERAGACVINTKIVLENPLEVHYVAVEVLDVNDHSPTFSVNQTRLEISESALPGARFQLQGAHDPDSDAYSIQLYKLSQNEHFRLEVKDRGDDGKIPVLYLHKPLDKETARSHTLVLTAADGGKPARSGTMTIKITVLDVNDNMPVFAKESYVAVLRENSPIGTTVLQVNATDLDDGLNGEVVYSFGNNVNHRLRKLFEIDADTGEIIVKGQIDYEMKDRYEIDIKASDKGSAPLETEKSVKITILDLNDNAPEIEVTSFSKAVPEDSKPGTTVALISVSDKDSGVNGKVICFINEDVPFMLSPTLQANMYSVVTKSVLDREHESKYDITITAKDAGDQPLSSHRTISVSVSDVNDNSPEFVTNPYTFYVTENNDPGTTLFSVSAQDCDERDNSLISYNIIRNGNQHQAITSFLNINSENGQISALKSFDFEAQKMFQFQVVASDSGSPSLSSNVTVKVFILDQNDNAPVILYPVSSNGSAEGLEEIPRNVNAGHLVTKVRAYDADIGYNGWLLFALQEVSDHSLFGLDRYTGQIRTLRSFTETDEAEHKLVILVKDNGNVSLSATATVLVKLVEPKEAFAASDVQSSVRDDEDSHVTFYLMITLGSVSVLFIISIIVLIAMQCSKSPDYTSKYVPETNYDGTLCHSIQYRSGDKRYMLVGPRMSIGSTIVPGSHANTLVLPDRRRTNEELRYSIPEELGVGAVIGNVAKDLGLDANALNARGFRIVSGSSEPPFQLSNNGILHVNRIIDREEVCERAGACVINTKIVLENPLEVHYVAVEVLDVNDHSPTFSVNQTRLEISESALPGARFQLQGAHDPDSDAYSIQLYKLSQNEHFRLEVKDRGDDGKIPVLYLHKPLDKETARSHTLVLTAADGGKPARSGTMTIKITVLDVNDNMPVFAKESYVAVLRENSPIGTTVLQVNATDLDDGLNGEVVYSFGNNVNHRLRKLFEIDADTGEIIVKGQIDYEMKDRYEIDIKASDKGSAPLETEKSVKITILDLNDNAPEIEVTSFSKAVPEDSKPGTTVALISVSDKDSGVNGKVICFINEDVPFMLSPTLQANMYSVVTKSVLDREHESKYDITITAKDAGDQPLSSHRTISVSVSDVNDNSPEFVTNPYTFYVTENNDPGTTLFSVSAQDCDERDNSLISYNIIRNGNQHQAITSFLNINSENGQISALKSFDFEAQKMFQFQVVASDSGSPSLSSNVTVKVFILDQNDNAPVILYPVSSNGSAEGLEEIPRNVNAGHLVTKVRAYDADIGYNGWLLFALQEVSDHSLFGLDRYTGQIRTLRSFTETDEAEHKLVILVKDNGNVSLSATATVLVKLVEPKEAFAASDCSKFCPGRRGRSPEDGLDVVRRVEIQIGHPVGSVAKDLGLDISTLADRRFRIVPGPNHHLFQLNQDNGVLYVGKNIDREELCDGTKVCLINLKIVVESPLEIHYVGVEIADVNDHAPSFPESEQRLEIAEHTPPGTRFQIHAARDPDAATLTVRSYKLSHNDCFDIDIRESEEDKIPFLVLKKPLDREQKAQHSLTLTALDGGNPSRSGSLNLTIEVLDTNDNRPVFSKDIYLVSLDENAQRGTLVVQLNATDLDEGLNGEIEYSFGKTQKKKVQDTFELDSVTGEIRVKGNVDFEETEVFRLDIQASDKGHLPWTAESRVVIKIKDINDNRPEIEITSLSTSVPEDAKPGTVISLISIRDKDSGLNGKVICKISGDVPFDLTPSIEENMYSLVTKGRLDRERVAHYDIIITATDCGDPPLSAVKSLTVYVSDVNDNRPVFNQNPFELYLVENNAPGASIFSVSAVDDDLNENALVNYNIIRGDGLLNDLTAFLNINSENGQISALKSFDFETLKTFQFQVVASDSGSPSLSSNVTVKVFILDQNDNAPVILYPVSSNGSAEGLEEIPRNVNAGHLVTKVRAYDADIGYNGWLLFALQEVSDHSLFGLDRYTGQIRTLRSFTETDETEHKLVILVKDNGNVSLSATATVLVKLHHRPDCNAVSKSPDYTSKYVPETNYDGTLCHSIQYRSGDKRYMLVGPRMSIGSTIVPGSHANTLVLPDRRRTNEEGSHRCECIWLIQFLKKVIKTGDRTSAHLVLQKQLDREKQDVISLTLTALDGGNPPKSGTSQIIISVLDINDNAPVFSRSLYKAQIPENIQAGTTVIVLNATDEDKELNAEIEFSLRSKGQNDVLDLFRIDPKSGAILVNGKIDYEENPAFEIHAQASDKGQPPMSTDCKVLVEVLDVNDNAPEITVTPLLSTVKEDAEVGTAIALVSVLDKDGGKNGIVRAAIANHVPFKLDTNYKNYYSLVVNGALDRESQAQFNVTIVACDEGAPPLSSTSTVAVQVSDVNDNAPRFLEQAINIYVKENSPVGATMKTITAVDADVDQSGQVRYSYLQRNSESQPLSSMININSETGDIVSLQSFDYEELKTFQFQVQATDSGVPPLSSNVSVNVFILDENDNNPAILAPYSEHGSVNTTVSIEVVVVESGADIQTPFRHNVPVKEESFSDLNLYLLIAIVAVSAIFLLSLITLIAVRCHRTDGGLGSRSLYKAQIPENTQAGTTVIVLNATDEDKELNAEIEFSLRSKGQNDVLDLFRIDPKSGAILVNGKIDYEENPAFEIHAQASDKGQPPMSTDCKVLVEVLDVNDNAPEITVTSLLSTVKEDAEVGTAIALVSVLDKDGGKNGIVRAAIANHVPFKLDTNYKNYYSLVVNGALDRESQAQFNVTIVACDEGAPPLSSTSTVAVQVSDVNDNAPRFLEQAINIYVKENSPVGATMKTITAVDADVDQSGQVRYSYLQSNSESQPLSSMININSETGDIVSLQSFDYEELKTFQFQVQATDSGVPPLSSNVSVNVFILDENDNNPAILAPYSEHGSVNSESIPYSAEAGYFVAKIRAVDLDSGYNALLSYHLSEPKGNNLFRMGTSTGEIRTKRRMSDNDLKSHPLVVLVSDNGEPSLSATVSIEVVVVESGADIQTPFRHNVPMKEESFSDLNLYLLIAIVAVSAIFLLSLITLIAVRCHRTDGGLGRYGAPMITTHPDGSWSYSKSTQQYDVCFSSDTLKSDVVVFPAAFPPVDAELISINGGDTFTRTQTLPTKEKVRPSCNLIVYKCRNISP